ncbi:hypothetical protein AAH178_004562 [Serratia marcescens]
MNRISALLLAFFLQNPASANDADIETTVFKISSTNHNYKQMGHRLLRWDSISTRINPLYGCNNTRCSLGILYSNGYNMREFYSFGYQEWATKPRTIEELARAANANGLIGRTLETGWSPFPEKGEQSCVSLAYQAYGGPMEMYGTEVQCGYGVISPNVCRIMEPVIELFHGTITTGQVNGRRVSSYLHVSCEFPLTIRLTMKNAKGYIPLDYTGVFRSEISINGTSIADRGVLVTAVPGAGSRVSIDSTLRGYNGQIGDFVGASVLVVAVE